MMTKDNLRKLTGDERLGQMRDSEYLGAEDIDDDVEPVLTIDALWNGMVTLQRGKENKEVLSFKEERVPGIMQVRPLIINSTNRKTCLLYTSRTRREIADYLGVKTVFYAMGHYVQPLLQAGKLAMTLPETPKSSKQKFYTV